MSLERERLEKQLCERLCEEVRLSVRPDGAFMLRTRFEFPDGDRFPLHVSETRTGGVRLSDRGHTLMHMSYDHDIDTFLRGSRGMLLERLVNETGVSQDGGEFFVECSTDDLPGAVFQLGQALTRIYDLTLLSRSRVKSTFYDDLADLLTSLIDQDRIAVDYRPEGIPNPEAYPVDYRIEGKSSIPLFLYGIPNRDKARLTTIMLSHFNQHGVRYESLLVFEDQADIPRLDLARLSDVGGEMISSLESASDFERKLLARAA